MVKTKETDKGNKSKLITTSYLRISMAPNNLNNLEICLVRLEMLIELLTS